ncbi:MAG TPA: S-layer homology domain-containing protein, partial [Candidatus Deferrimicrobium sp.]|nr:S-layer homology domain-containing protein [Candidatus Deferrimicrobium sp.]
MRRFLSIVVAVVMLVAVCSPVLTANAAGFKDVAASYWAFDEITALASKKVVAGYADGTFKPEGKVTREEFAKMIVVAKGLALVKPAKASFTDVAASRWSYGYVEAAAKAGYIKGIGGGKFAPAAPIKRQDMAILLVRAVGKEQAALSAPVKAVFSNDEASVGAYALPHLAYAVSPAAQFLLWDVKRNINPVSSATRAECAHGIYMSLFPPKQGGNLSMALTENPDSLFSPLLTLMTA